MSILPAAVLAEINAAGDAAFNANPGGPLSASQIEKLRRLMPDRAEQEAA